MPHRIHKAKVRVEFEDCDAMGVVYHPNYLRFIERSRVDYLRTHKVPFAEMLAGGAGLVIAEVHALYWRPVRMEEEIYVYTRQIELTEKRVVLEQFISRIELDSTMLLKPMERISGKVFGAKIVLASVDMKSLRSAPLPEGISTIMRGLTVKPEA